MKLISFILSIFLLGVFMVGTATAQQDPSKSVCENNAGSSVCVGSQNKDPLFGPNGVLTKVIQILVMICGVASIFMVIIGGFKYVTSTGDPAKVNSAKDTILYAVIGLVITIIAQGIVVFVLKRL